MARRVIDANVGVALALATLYSPAVLAHVASWREQGDSLYVPTLWQYEVASVLRKSIVARVIQPGEALEALDALMNLDLIQVPPTAETHRRALAWAERLKQGAAYDAQYLAVAEQLAAEFWTADRRLLERARQVGASWVRHVEE